MTTTKLTLKRITAYDITLRHPAGWSQERLRAVVNALSAELSWDARDADTTWEVADLSIDVRDVDEKKVADLTEEDLEHLPEGPES